MTKTARFAVAGLLALAGCGSVPDNACTVPADGFEMPPIVPTTVSEVTAGAAGSDLPHPEDVSLAEESAGGVPAPVASASEPPPTSVASLTEPPAADRPVIAREGDDVRVQLPTVKDGSPSEMIFRIVEIEDQPVPFLEINTSAAAAPGEFPVWNVTLDGGKLSKFGANTGGTYGIRLGGERFNNALTTFVVAIWAEELDSGEAITERVEFEMDGR